MTEFYTGGCACGALRYRIGGAPLFSNHCHCRDCQHKSGTGHGSYMTFRSEDASMEGAASRWDMVADSGAVKTRGFCPTCGSPVFLTFADAPQHFAIHAASLDDPARFTPEAVTYAVRAPDWDRPDPTLRIFEKMPA
jgi:hypothetical protein